MLIVGPTATWIFGPGLGWVEVLLVVVVVVELDELIELLELVVLLVGVAPLDDEVTEGAPPASGEIQVYSYQVINQWDQKQYSTFH